MDNSEGHEMGFGVMESASQSMVIHKQLFLIVLLVRIFLIITQCCIEVCNKLGQSTKHV